MAKSSKTTKPAKKTAPKKKAATKKVAAPKAPPAPVAKVMAETPLAREHLPIPDPKHVGLTTYDAKDPNTKYPPITPLRPPEGAPNVLIVLIDDVGFGASSAFGGPCNTPVAERLAANGLKLNRFHTTALCSPTRQAHADRPQPSLGGHGRDHRDGDLGAGQQQHPAQGEGADRRDVEAQRLLDRPVRQVPRGAGLGGHRRPGRSTSGPPARVSSTSTASSAARPTSTTPGCTRAPRPSSRRSRPRRVTPSPRISPTGPSPGCGSRRR